MTRRNKPHGRCTRCSMRASLCLCELVPRLETRTEVVLVAHKDELRKPTNTGRLAIDCLVRGRIVVRGEHGRENALEIEKERVPLILFPHADAVELDRMEFESDVAVTLIVPDGTWRQARKVRTRTPELANVPCVKLPFRSESSYRLRNAPGPNALSTIEAIADALAILEGPSVQAGLQSIFRTMVDRTMWLRGRLSTEQVEGGIPIAAQSNDPRGRGPRKLDP